jgi:hypothetical protein
MIISIGLSLPSSSGLKVSAVASPGVEADH